MGVSHDAHSAVVIELNSETDFVARNPKFQALVRSIAEAARGVKGTQSLADGSTSLVVSDLEVRCFASFSFFHLITTIDVPFY